MFSARYEMKFCMEFRTEVHKSKATFRQDDKYCATVLSTEFLHVIPLAPRALLWRLDFW